jgi:predicted DNA-binding transcriptional regulator AlpA
VTIPIEDNTQRGTSQRGPMMPAWAQAPSNWGSEAPTKPVGNDADELWDLKTVRAFFGGVKPIGKSTLYDGIKAGRYPKPINLSPKTSRWLRSECEAMKAKAIQARPQ